MNVSRFYPEHLWAIELPADHPWPAIRDLTYAQFLAESPAFTVRHHGRILACGGVARLSRDVGICWSFLSKDSARHMLALHRIARRVIEVSGFIRVLANKETTFCAGCRWLGLLGFERIDTIEGFEGRDNYLYARMT